MKTTLTTVEIMKSQPSAAAGRRDPILVADNRKTILRLTALAVLTAGLFPPWLYTTFRGGTDGFNSAQSAGYHFILTPPPPQHDNPVFGVKLDSARLLIECGCIMAISGAAWGVAKLNIKEEQGKKLA